MNKAKKRLISVLLIALMVCTLLPTSAFAANEGCGVTKTAFNQFYPNTDTYNVVDGNWAETGYGTVILSDEVTTATDYALTWYYGNHYLGWPKGFEWLTVSSSNPAVATATVASGKDAANKPCLVVNFSKGTQSGTTKITVGYTVTELHVEAGIATDSDTAHAVSGELIYTVKIQGAPAEKPNPPTPEDIGDIFTGSHLVISQCDKMSGHNAGYKKMNNPDAFTIGKVVDNTGNNPDFSIAEYPYMCEIVLNTQFFADNYNYNYGKEDGTHYVKNPDTQYVSFFLYYSDDWNDWTYSDDMFPLTIALTETKPVTTYTVTYTDGVEGEEVFADQVHTGLALNAPTPAFEGIPIRKDHMFMGWTPSLSSDVVDNTTYTATWAKTQLKVTFVNDDWETLEDYSFEQDLYEAYDKMQEDQEAYANLYKGTTPEKDGKVFDGWDAFYCIEGPEGAHYIGVAGGSRKDIGEIKYFPRWKEEPTGGYTVTYTDGVKDEEIFADQVYTGLALDADTPAFNGTPAREGYDFKGWNPVVLPKVTGNALYTATWQKSGSEKEGEPGMEKKVNGMESISAAAGETVTYTLKSNVPSYLKEYFAVPDPIVEEAKKALLGAADEKTIGEYVLVLHDALQTGVSFNNDIQVTVNGETLDSSLYSVTTTAEDACTFEITMDLVKIYAVGGYFTEEEIAGCPEIVVTYTGTVSSDATAGIYKNIAWAAYEGKESAKPEVNVYVYGIKIFKYDLNNSNAPLAGAKFVLLDEKGGEVATGISNTDGYIIFDGLKEGEYKIQETAAPDGYACSNKVVAVKLPGDASADYYANVRFANQLVPHTGGNGTMMYTVGGSVLILAAALLFIVSRKTKRNTKA